MFWCSISWSKPPIKEQRAPLWCRHCQPWQWCKWKEHLHSHRLMEAAGGGGERGSPPCQLTLRHVGSQNTPVYCKKSKWAWIITSGHIFTGMETANSEIVLKCTSPFCCFPCIWTQLGQRGVSQLNGKNSGPALKAPSSNSPISGHVVSQIKFSIPIPANVVIFKVLPTSFF